MYSSGHCFNHSTVIMPDLRVDSTRRGMAEERRALFDSYRRRSSLPAEITLPQAYYSSTRLHQPLPLQCLAADALPQSLKEEIEKLTLSSLAEYSHQEMERDIKGADSPSLPDTPNEHTVTVPLQFFTNGNGLRIVGGIRCRYSGEKHAQIVVFKHMENKVDPNVLLPSFQKGLCIVEMEGHSLRNVSFEDVRKIMRDLKSALVKLVIKDCCRDQSNSTSLGNASIAGTSGLDKQVGRKKPHFLTLRKQRRGSIISLGTPPPEARTYRDILKDDNSPSPSIKKDLLEVSFEFANDSTLTKKPSPRLFPRHSSTQSLDSLSSENTGMEEKSILTNQNRVAKISLRYLRKEETFCVNLHRIKSVSRNSVLDQSSVFINTYIFPDKRSQGVQSCKPVSSTVSTESLIEFSAQYHLTREELSCTSLRILLWESGNALRSKKTHFRGEVFLSLDDESSKFVNLEGVPQWYSLCPLDRNLPSLPSPHPPFTHGTLMKKMKAIANNTTQNFGTLTKRRKGERKRLEGVTGGGTPLSHSMQDIAQQNSKVSDVPSLLEPLKEKKNKKISLPEPPLRRPSSSRSNRSKRNSLLSLFELTNRRNSIAEEDTDSFSLQKMASSPMLDIKDDPPTSDKGNLSLVEFLDGLNTPRTKAKLLKFSQGLRQKSFSQDVLDIPSTRRPLSLSSASMHGGSESSIGSYSETSSVTSFNKPVQLVSGWSDHTSSSSEDILRPPPSAEFSPPPQTNKSVLRHYSFLDSMEDVMGGASLESPTTQLLRLSSKVKKSTPKRKTSLNDGYDHLLPFLRLNDNAPFSPQSLSSSTETLTPHGGGGVEDEEAGPKPRSSSWNESDTVPSGRSLGESRLSRSMDGIAGAREWSQSESDDCHTQSSLDLSDSSSSSRGFSQSLSQDSEFLASYSMQHVSSSQKPNKYRMDGSSGLESIMERSMEDSVHVETLKRIKKRSLSMEALASTEHHENNEDKTSNQPVLPALVSMRKDSKIGTIRRLYEAYKAGKPNGSVNIILTAKIVSRVILVDVVDVVFYSQKLMNAEYTVKVNLFNRFNEKCEMSRKEVAVFRKNGMHEQKQLPPLFEFSGDPSVYHVQIQFQIKNRIFGRKVYHSLQDVDAMNGESNNIWLPICKLPSQ